MFGKQEDARRHTQQGQTDRKQAEKRGRKKERQSGGEMETN